MTAALMADDLKTCTKCDVPKPRTTKYFHKHNATKDRLDPRCKECQSAAKKQHYLDNKDEINARTTAYAKAHPDKVREIWQRYHANHREERIQAWNEWAKNNPERVEAYRIAYKPKHADNIQARRARLREQFVEDVDRHSVFERDEGICGECKKPVDWADFELDHIIPIIHGGEHSYANTQTTHKVCNRRKSDRMPEPERV